MRKKLMMLLCACIFAGCIGGGTHGYIKAYRYAVSKAELENAARQVIFENPLVTQDSVKSYYNDDTGYVTMNVVVNGKNYNYTFRYYGGKAYWDTSGTSEIFIAYAYDADHKGGSSGNGGVKWYDVGFRKRLTQPFEQEFISRIDSILGIGHTEE